MRVPNGLLVALALSVALALPTVAAAESSSITTRLPAQMGFGNATMMVGTVAATPAPMDELGAIRVQSLDLPEGTLFVCPSEQGERDEIPPLPVVENRCRGEESFEDPIVSVRDRTWIRSRGNVTMDQAANASLTMLWTREDGRIQWGASVSSDGLRLGLADDAWAFEPTVGSSQIHVEGDGNEGMFNGTSWIFYFQGSGAMNLRAAGTFGTFQEPVGFSVTQAPIEALADALEPRRLLDVQVALLGADAREPTRNATRLFETHGRIPHLINGALFGHLDGQIGDRELSSEGLSLIRTENLVMSGEEDELVGDGEVRYTRTEGGFGSGASAPHEVPWWVSIFFWIPAGALVWMRDPPKPARWHAWAAGAVLAVALLVFDARLGSLTGTSAWGLLVGGDRLGYVMAIVGFEMIALGLGWLLCYLPIRIGLERLLPEGSIRFTRPSFAVAALGLILLFPGPLIVVGQWVARL